MNDAPIDLRDFTARLYQFYATGLWPLNKRISDLPIRKTDSQGEIENQLFLMRNTKMNLQHWEYWSKVKEW